MRHFLNLTDSSTGFGYPPGYLRQPQNHVSELRGSAKACVQLGSRGGYIPHTHGFQIQLSSLARSGQDWERVCHPGGFD